MSAKSDGPARLKRFRTGAGLSLRSAAAQLGVQHVTVMAWESGRNTPTAVMRAAIERWSSGAVPGASWKLGERERHLAEQAGDVVPFVAPDLGAAKAG